MTKAEFTDNSMQKAGYTFINAKHFDENVIKLIGYDWMLITAGDEEKINTMTASWGGLGVLWNKPVAYIFIRPVRYTYAFVEKHDYFTCSFYSEQYRDLLNFCGKYSGRDYDKVKETQFTPIHTGNSFAFSEARVIIECKKIYAQDIAPENFLDRGIARHYPDADYHRMYIGEITSIWKRQLI